MDARIYSTTYYQEEIKKTSEKESELLRLLQVKSEKICNDFLSKKQNTQLSYLTKEQQAGALSLPKGIILDKLLHYLRSL